MRSAFFSLLLLLSLALPCLAAGDDSTAPLEAANRLLRAELELARTNQIYFIFDLGEKPRVQFKGSGVTVAELPILASRIWGLPPTVKVRTLATKDTLFPPKRQKIIFAGEGKLQEEKPEPKAEAKEGSPPDLGALELDDMPTSFMARLDDGTLLTVHPAPAESFTSRVTEISRSLYWYLSRPLISDWHFFKGKPYTEVRLVLPPRDVRLLYWSFTEGAPCLISY
jgi:hypothetical protein